MRVFVPIPLLLPIELNYFLESSTYLRLILISISLSIYAFCHDNLTNVSSEFPPFFVSVKTCLHFVFGKVPINTCSYTLLPRLTDLQSRTVSVVVSVSLGCWFLSKQKCQSLSPTIHHSLSSFSFKLKN